MKYGILIITIIALFGFCLTGCGKSPSVEEPIVVYTSLEHMLKNQSVPFTKIVEKGRDVTIYYETSDSTSYDDQIVADWGFIFASAASFDYDTVTIANTIAGEQAALLKTPTLNVKNFAAGNINESQFWEGVTIKATP